MAIVQYCGRLPEDTVTLVLLPEMDWQGKQTKWFMALEAVAMMIKAAPVDRSRLPQWVPKGQYCSVNVESQTAFVRSTEWVAWKSACHFVFGLVVGYARGSDRVNFFVSPSVVATDCGG